MSCKKMNVMVNAVVPLVRIYARVVKQQVWKEVEKTENGERETPILDWFWEKNRPFCSRSSRLEFSITENEILENT